MCLDTATDMNETLNIVIGDNSDTVIDFGYEKNFYIALSDDDNENIYIPIVPTLPEESAVPIIADENAVEHVPKNSPQSPPKLPWSHLNLYRVLVIIIVVEVGHDIVCTHAFFAGGEGRGRGVEPPTKFFKIGGGFTGSQFLQGGCKERGGGLFQEELSFFHKKKKF